MIKGGKVSIWIGGINSEDELLAYVDDGPFGEDFDFNMNPNVGRELITNQHSVLLSELVHGFSYSKEFGRTCVKNAGRLGFDNAHCVVILYAFEYIPSKMINNKSPLKFIGVFNF